MAAGARGSLIRDAFWDASALAPLCVNQTITPLVRALYKKFRVTVWWATPVEIASALARLSRMSLIDTKELAVATKLAEDLADAWWVVQPSESVRSRATLLVSRHDLRAADSLQLSSAIEWCEDHPHAKVFLTADQRLRQAAQLYGFDTSHL